MARFEYTPQNPKREVTPPHIPLRALRIRLGLRLADVCAEVTRVLDLDKPFTVGSLSAIETGQRGVSAELLVALQTALGLAPGDIETDYTPSHSRRKSAVEGEAA